MDREACLYLRKESNWGKVLLVSAKILEKKYIERRLRLGGEPHKALKEVHSNEYTENDLSDYAEGQTSRNEFCTQSDVQKTER